MNKKISEALNFLPDDLIEKAAKGRRGYITAEASIILKLRRLATPFIAAACLVITLGVAVSFAARMGLIAPDGIAAELLTTENDTYTDITEDGTNDKIPAADDTVNDCAQTENENALETVTEIHQGPVTIEAAKINSNMSTGVFIYNGRIYMQSGKEIDDTKILGEQIGTIDDRLAEWYTENMGGSGLTYASTVMTVFKIEGLSPDFALGAIHESGKTYLYLQNNGITLNNGGDLFITRLQLDKYIDGGTVTIDKVNIFPLDGKNLKATEKLLDAIKSAPMISNNYIRPIDEFSSPKLNFKLAGKIDISVNLYEGGYVSADMPVLDGYSAVIGNEALAEFLSNFEK